MYWNIDVKLIDFLLNLDENKFYEYEDFIKELKELEQTKKFEPYDFIGYCKEVIGSNKRKDVIFNLKHRESAKLYGEFINKYYVLLEEACHADLYRKLVFSALSNTDMLAFYYYLKENYEQKKHFAEVIAGIEALGIEGFEYVGLDENLDGRYSFKIDSYPKQNDVTIYNVKGVATDGTKNWLSQTGAGNYLFDVTGVNYLINYTRENISYYSSQKIEIKLRMNMKLRNLNFSVADLPSYEELHDLEVFPKIDVA